MRKHLKWSLITTFIMYLLTSFVLADIFWLKHLFYYDVGARVLMLIFIAFKEIIIGLILYENKR